MALLDVKDLCVEYRTDGGAFKALSNVSLTVSGGEVVGIIGDSGSGKSSLVLALLGMARPGGWIAGGSVKVEGVEVLGASRAILEQVRGRRVGFISQQPKASLNPVQRVGNQLVTVLRAKGSATRAEAPQRALQLLRRVGIADAERRMKAFPHELSGGMAQRVLIAIALAADPALILADEPTSGLDVTLQAQILDDLKRAARDAGSSLVIITHDIGLVGRYCDRVYVLNAGEVVETGPVGSFFERPRHPAGASLLAVERIGGDRSLTLSGLPIDRRRLPAGCWMVSRCPLAEASSGCLDAHPELEEVEPGRWVRCHRQDIVAQRAARATHAG